jgi:hypothetical protein
MDLYGKIHWQPALMSKDLSAQAWTSAWALLKLFNHVAIHILKAAGASGEPPTFTFQQGKTVSGNNAKALNFTKYKIRDAADVTTVGTFTETAVASTNTITPAAGNTQEHIVVEFDAQDLDFQNGFNAFNVSIADVGSTAQLCSIMYEFSEPRYSSNVSPIAN